MGAPKYRDGIVVGEVLVIIVFPVLSTFLDKKRFVNPFTPEVVASISESGPVNC